ncbi:acyl-peptide hydrolase [Bryobacterales bacterium F-183]|nr:acyl-peptide hydrolase [Bryobacterales bacterium F-183]
MFASLVAFTLATWTPEAQLKVTGFGEVVPSPDGKLTAWTEVRPGYARLRIGGKEVPVWTGTATGLTFSPDGKYLYWQSGNVAFRTLTQGPGEPQRLSRYPGNVGPYKLSPDGTMLAFLAQEEIAPKSRIRVVGELKYRHKLCTMPSDGTSGEVACKVTPVGFAAGLEWSPDGRAIAFESRVTPFPDDSRTSDIYEADLATGELHEIAKTGASEAQPAYSPDGRYLAYVRSDNPPLQPGDEHLVLYDRTRKSTRALPFTQDRLPKILGWSPDSRNVYYTEARGTRNVVFAMPLDGPPTSIFTPDGVASAMSPSHTGKYLGFALETAESAPEAHLLTLGTGKPEKLSAVNANVESVGKTEIFWWRSRDNLEIEGLITYPANFDKSKKYPMIVILHGGPYGNFTESFVGRSGLYPIATFAAKGYVVFRPNPRASTGYGRDFRYANLKDWGGGDYNDVITGVRNVIGLGFVDKSRMAVMGWSYGGFLTNWTVTHTNEFKAAAAGAGVSNLLSQTGTSDIRSNKIDAFGAPWDNQQFYIERSPLTYAKNVTTPTLFLGGDADERVPISQTYEMYHALKRRGVPTQMVVYPGAPHSPTDPEYVLDIMKRHIDWVERYVQ